MQPQSDLLIDRKRLKSQITFWRVVALLVIFGGMALWFAGFPHKPGVTPGKDYIAELTIEGVMTDDPKRDEMMKDIRDDSHAKAVIVRLDSPGGTTVGGEEIYLQLREIAKKKPVVGVMHTLCASACYMASLGTDQVFARDTTLTGSIGVLMESVELSRLADKLGITPIAIKSGPYKDVPDIGKPFTAEEAKVVGQIVTDAYDKFVSMIVERRQMSDAMVRTMADGRVYTGRQAANLKLIDAIGGNDEAVNWLANTHKINPKLDIVEIKPDTEEESLLGQLGQYTGIKIFGRSARGLDGLLSIWHPSPIQ